MQYNIYNNVVVGPMPNAAMPNPDEIDAEFVEAANEVLRRAAELVRSLIGAHQSAIAIVVGRDWSSVRKYFSLSDKYQEWADYTTPATGYGTHGWLLQYNQVVRLTQAELEAHPQWKNFGTEAGKHPPMRGWLAAPLIDRHNTNWGLIQLSDKYEGDFDEVDERHFVEFAMLVSGNLETLWEVRNLKKQIAGRS